MHRSILLLSLAVFVAPLGHAQWGPSQQVGAGSCIHLKVGDLDNDGDGDVVAIHGSQVRVYKSNPGGTFDAPVVLVNVAQMERHLLLTDHDKDGWIDILVGYDNNAYWYRNLGGGTFGAPSPLLNSARPSRYMAVGSINGDSNPDYVSATSGGGSTNLWVHLSTGGGGYQSTFMTLPLLDINELHITDWDGDALADVFVSTSTGQFYWVEVDSSGSMVSTDLMLFATHFVTPADMDGDGDQDIVKQADANFVGWWENLGNGTVGGATLDNTVLFSVSPPIAVDFDSDGDLDIAGVDDLVGRVFWVENLGSGVLGPMQTIDFSPGQPSWISFGDFDHDGDSDIVIAVSGLGVFWYANGHALAPAVCPAALNSSMESATLTATGSRFVSDNDVTLHMENAPPGQFTLMQNSRGFKESFPGNSSGVRCVAAPFHFYRGLGEVAQTDANGAYDITLDLTVTPDVGGFAPVLAGESWYFQAWFRDRNPGPTSNFSEAVVIQFR